MMPSLPNDRLFHELITNDACKSALVDTMAGKAGWITCKGILTIISGTTNASTKSSMCDELIPFVADPDHQELVLAHVKEANSAVAMGVRSTFEDDAGKKRQGGPSGWAVFELPS